MMLITFPTTSSLIPYTRAFLVLFRYPLCFQITRLARLSSSDSPPTEKILVLLSYS